MTRADLEAAAREKYPALTWQDDAQRYRQEGYIQGRLDQAEADAQIAEARVFSDEERKINPDYAPMMSAWSDAAQQVAAAIRKGVE